ncbi:hypothetical protein VTL71DRAFT_8313 [Oculimacula yallundae]|uniref:Uncharacterized protein n=1 Tax=Oculimacula yallundae TaxID=86028 RepID=A0ABR4CXB3_9HELO
MTSSRRFRPAGSISHQYDGASPGPSVTVRIRKRSRDAIPKGAVAARVKLLQSFNASLPGQPISLASKGDREDSRFGFGRRLSNRFGNPAIQSAQPDEEPQVVDSRHSYLGLNIARSNHEEEHALADSNTRYSRSPGINGQIDQGIDERAQYDAASPWGALSRTKSVLPDIHDSDTRYSRSPGINGQIDQGTDERAQYDAASPWGALLGTKSIPPPHSGHSPDLDVLKEIDSSGNQTKHMSPTSIFPSTARKDNAGMFSCQIKPRRSKFVDSEASIMTTSTMRRQNVRDLFDDYGIQRPAGLASREVSRVMDEPIYSVEKRVFCHICSWSNSRTPIKCWRSGHRFCAQCKEYPSQMPTTQEESSGHDKLSGQRKSVSNPKENRVEHDPMKLHQARPGPTPMQYPLRKASSPPIKFPDFHDPPKPQKSPRKISAQIERHEQSPVHLLTGLRTTTSVKESPFLMADLKFRPSLRLSPPAKRGETHHIAQNHRKHHSKHQRLARYTSTIPSESLSCDSRVCRATHHSHQLFHNTSTSACPRRKSRHRVPEGTENGYIADTSCVDDAPNSQSRCNSRLSSPAPGPAQPSGSGCSRLTCTTLGLDLSQSHVLKVDCSTKDEIPEYVECRGYPRTGHDRHGSPISTGIIGECQHCLDDCQFEACQNTHHSVRCCVHTDHQTIVHHHHTPRKTTIDCSEERVVPNNEKTPVQAHGSPAILPRSNAHDQKVSELSVNKKHQSELPAYAKQPPTPPPLPPMVRSPRYEDKRPNRDIRKVDTTRVEKIAEVTEPPSKDNTPPSHRTPQEDSDLEASAEPTNGTWFTITSDHDHEHIHSRRNSCPSSRKYSLEIPIQRRDSISPRTQITPPESEKDTRKLSTSRKRRNQSSVQALKEQLLSHREELQKIQQDCTEQINLPAHSGVAELAQRIERKSNTNIEDAYTPSISSKGSGGSKNKKNWKLKLVDFNPERRKKGGEEHQLSDDEVVSEKESYKAMPSVSTAEEASLNWGDSSLDSSIVVSGREHSLSVDEVVLDEIVMRLEGERERESAHDCVWKKRFEELSRTRKDKEGDLAILGVTVLVHLKGRADLVAKAESWAGGGMKV